MVYRMIRSNFGFLCALALSSALSACGGSSSVISDSSSESKPVSASPAPSTPASNDAAVAPSPAPSGAVQSAPSPTPHPVIKQAQAKPGEPMAVPESMKRPLNAEEMKKALQQLPPEVRARIMGLQQMPAPTPQPAKK